MRDLTSCPDCRGWISRSASVCPHCGCDLSGYIFIKETAEERSARRRKEWDKRMKTFGPEVYEAWLQLNPIKAKAEEKIKAVTKKKVKAQKNKEKQKERKAKEIAERNAKEIAERKEKGKKALLKRIEKENAKRAAKEKKDAAEQKQEQVQKANEKQERITQRRLLIQKGEPEIDYKKLIDMKKSERQYTIIFLCSIGIFFILPWLISLSGICFSMFMYDKKVLKRLKEVFGQEISEKYNNNFQKLYTEYKDDINHLSEK